MADLPLLRIFLSSPGDVSEERARAQVVFRRLAHARWRTPSAFSWWIGSTSPSLRTARRRIQIERPSKCDLVVNILWSRLGTRLPSDYASAPGEPAPTGTEVRAEGRDEVLPGLSADRTCSSTCEGPPAPIYGSGPRRAKSAAASSISSTTFAAARSTTSWARSWSRITPSTTGRSSSGAWRFTYASGWPVRIGKGLSGERLLWREGSPFVGLGPFDAKHRAVFFGRSHAVSEIVGLISKAEKEPTSATSRMLLVQGMSGAGKTSLLKAGVLPFLTLRPVEGIAEWMSVSLPRPTQQDASSLTPVCWRFWLATSASYCRDWRACPMPFASSLRRC